MMLPRTVMRFQRIRQTTVDLSISLEKRSLLLATGDGHGQQSLQQCSHRLNCNWDRIISNHYFAVPNKAVRATGYILFPMSKYLPTSQAKLKNHQLHSDYYDCASKNNDNRNRYRSRPNKSQHLESESITFDYKRSLGIVGLVGALLAFGTSYFFDLLASIGPSPVYASNNKNNFIADIVEKTAPAVVYLEIKGKHPFTGKSVTLSNGSGFIVRKNGLILTNAHVVQNKSIVSVKLQDGSVYDGYVTAVDPITDLATVKINANNLSTVPLGNSDEIRPGEWVIAMGSPLSLSNTVTCGIVSSVHRASKELGLHNKDMDYIQTDAVINFGNSGGPLVNLDGYAIGINTMKVTTGISFAIPSDYAQTFLAKTESMMSKGITENAYLKKRFIGITMLTLSQNVMRDLKSNHRVPNFPDVDGGVFVYKIIPGTPAHVGGVLAGDIIIEINDSKVLSASDVYSAVDKADILNIIIIRGQTRIKITINTLETK